MKARAGAVLATVLLAGCATTAAPPPDERHPQDPWEPYNRRVFAFNDALDRAMLRPLAVGYDKVAPRPVKHGVRNFFANIRSPVNQVNLLLQGRPKDAGTELGRFALNTVFGIGGLFDVASNADIPSYREDFGQTMAVWGWEDSRYFVLPLLGPSTLRDGIGRPADSYANFIWRWALDETSYWWIGLDVIQIRHALLPLDDDLRDAYDPYTFMRDGWLQHRAHQISEGEQDLPDYESFLEEDWDDQPRPGGRLQP